MEDTKYKSLIQKINRLEKIIDGMDARIELLIHSVNGLYEDLYEEDPEEIEDDDDVELEEEEEVSTESEEKSETSLADLILAFAGALTKVKE